MPVVIDVNALSSVFAEGAKDYADFEPVRKWVLAGTGKIVFGGSKYMKELSHSEKHLRFIREMKQKGKAVMVCSVAVDLAESQVTAKTVGDSDCDDQHIIALLDVSGCRALCSKDKRSFRFVKNRALYSYSKVRIYIYSRLKNAAGLCRQQSEKLRNLV